MTARWPTVMAAALLTFAAGCGEDQEQPADTMGSNGSVGSMLLRNVYVTAPGGNGYEPGDDATIRLTLINKSRQDDALTAVRSSHAENVVMRWDRECDGDLEQVTRIPVLGGDGTVPGADAAYRIELVDLTGKVRAGTTVPLTFTFRDAGEVRVDAMVEATHDGDVPAVPGCE